MCVEEDAAQANGEGGGDLPRDTTTGKMGVPCTTSPQPCGSMVHQPAVGIVDRAGLALPRTTCAETITLAPKAELPVATGRAAVAVGTAVNILIGWPGMTPRVPTRGLGTTSTCR